MTETMLAIIAADPKEEWDTGGEYHAPGSPHPPLENMAGSLADILGDHTRRDQQFAWIVRSVKPVQAAGDGTVRIGTDWRTAATYGWLFAALAPAVDGVHVFSRSIRAGGLFPGAVSHQVGPGDEMAEGTLVALRKAVIAADVTVFLTASAHLAEELRGQGVAVWLGR